MRRLACLTWCLSLMLPVIATAGPIEDCDRMAADPGVALSAIALPQAMESCAAALDLDDGSARLMYQYARTLEAAGDSAAARRYYGWAADDGYPPARMALLRLGGIPRAGTNATDTTDPAAAPDADPLRAYATAAGALPGDLAAKLAQDMTLLPQGAALRDPETTLALRRGSAPDLAQLFRALLRARDPGADLRYGLCTPRPDAAAGPPEPARPQTPLLVSDVLAQALAAPQPPALLLRLDQVWRAAMAEGRAEAGALASDIRAASPGFGSSPGPAPQPLRIAVELREGQGWRAYDPLRGGVFDPAQCLDYRSASQLPDTMVPRLHLSLRASEDAGDTQTERVVLQADIPLNGDAVLAFAEAWGIAPPGVAGERGMQTYTPVLMSGAQTVFGESLLLPLPPSATPEPGAALGSKLDAVAEALESAADTEPRPAADSTNAPPGQGPPTLSGLEADLRVDLAGAPPGAEEHLVLLRRGGPGQPLPDANGAYLDLMQLVGIVPLDGAGAADPPEAAADFVPSDAGLEAQARQSAGAMAGFEGLRRAVMAEITPTAMPLPRGIGMLVTLWTAGAPGAEGGSPGLVLRNQMRRGPEPVAPGTSDPAADAAAWAVASVLAERLSLQLGNEDFAAPGPGSDAVGLWTAARAGGAPARVLRSAADLEALPGLPPDGRARALAALTAGRVLLAPPDLSHGLAWWSLDPALGIVEDEFANGNRQAMTEEAKTNQEVACRNVGFFAEIAARVARAVAPVAILLAITGGGGDMGKAVVKMTRSIAQTQADIDRKRRAIQIASKACAGKSAGPGPDP